MNIDYVHMNESPEYHARAEPPAEVDKPAGSDAGACRGFSLARLASQMVREASPAYGGSLSGLDRVRKSVEDGLPAEAVKELQTQLKRLGVRRASEFVNKIVSRATLRRRDRLTREEGEAVLRVAAVIALARDVWGFERGAAQFLTTPHMLLGNEVPIELARSDVGARQVEYMIHALDHGLPV